MTCKTGVKERLPQHGGGLGFRQKSVVQSGLHKRFFVQVGWETGRQRTNYKILEDEYEDCNDI